MAVIWERTCGRNSIAAVGEWCFVALAALFMAIELPGQRRSQMEFGNEKNKGAFFPFAALRETKTPQENRTKSRRNCTQMKSNPRQE